MKQLTSREQSAIKRQFQNSFPTLQKINSITKKLNELQKEKETLEAFLEAGEAGVKLITGGYKSTDIVKCEFIPQFNEDGTPKMDKEGKYQIKKKLLTFVEPDTQEVTSETNQIAASNGCSGEITEEVENEDNVEPSFTQNNYEL
jgi:hypothetical protein